MRLRTAVFCAAAFGAVLSMAVPASAASTAQERREACSKEWNAAKEAGKVPADQTWSKFYSECNARLKAAEEGKATGSKTTEKTASESKAAAKPAAEESTRQSRMKQCSEEWKAAKEAGKVPADQTWPKFYSECNARLSGTAVAPAGAKPASASPATTKPAAAKVEDDEDTGEGVREPTPGQLAARQRMKDCGAEWRAEKAAGKIADGQTWPQYWSACNKRLKAAGH